jgi:hypothetical protein
MFYGINSALTKLVKTYSDLTLRWEIKVSAIVFGAKQ